MRIPLAILICGIGLLALLATIFLVESRLQSTPPPTPSKTESKPPVWQPTGQVNWIGTTRCAECHEEEHGKWLGSHHQLAMLEATPETVLGDFDNTSFTYRDGTTTTFSRQDDEFWVRTDGPNGELQNFRITHTFGVTPLQMYLIPFPDGRIQCLNVSWDSRPEEQGGQRWFHLYPNEDVDHEHPFHWTGRFQNWNFMCSECHSTRLRKRYDVETNTYDSKWFEINVACEACHGPGSHHAQWADAGEPTGVPAMGLVHQMTGARLGDWHLDPVTGKPSTNQLPRSEREINICARCHSRRGILTEDYRHGAHFLQHHDIRRLREHLYFSDGQIQDEVYVLGSFLQSTMHQQGVTCTDCHDPHTAAVYSPDNLDQLCARCHAPARYASYDHHFHPEETRCVDCHMPERTYMVVDPRRDHRFGSPRPDLTLRFGVPNACTDCHDDITDAGAVEILDDFYGKREHDSLLAEALDAGRKGLDQAPVLLRQLFHDPSRPAIHRATALDEWQRFGGADFAQAVNAASRAPDPLLRKTAANVGRSLSPTARLQLLPHLLHDDIRAVRNSAAHALVAEQAQLPATHQQAYQDACADYLSSQELNADRPEAQVNLGYYHAFEGNSADAETAYRRSIALDPSFAPAYANLADLKRTQGDEAGCLTILQQGLELLPEEASLHHALGLALTRQRRYNQAIPALATAARLAPDNPRYAYVHGVALASTGNTDGGIKVLKRAHKRHPTNIDILIAIIQYLRQAGQTDAAKPYEDTLRKHAGRDPAIRQLLSR
jgi:tetratricopeptide (TPR) repeat protein